LTTVIEEFNWEEIIKETEKRLYNFIRKRISNFADVDDVVQSTWLEVLLNKEKFHGHSRPDTWIFGIAMNLVKNYYKDKRLKSLTDCEGDDLDIEASPNDQPEDVIGGKELLKKAIAKFMQLPKEYQKMLKVIIENDFSYFDLSTALKIPIGTVRSRLSRLRQILKKELHWDKFR